MCIPNIVCNRSKKRETFSIRNVFLCSSIFSAFSSWNSKGKKKMLFIQTVNLMNTSQFIPNGGLSVPILGQYLLASVFYIAFSILATIKLSSINKSGNPISSASSWLSKLVFSKLTHLLGPKLRFEYTVQKSAFSANKAENCSTTTSKEHGTEVDGATKEVESVILASEKMKMIYETLNRFCFVLSSSILTISTAVMIVALLI